jgi:hypothetical protein
MAKGKIQTWPWLGTPAREAADEYRKDDERHYNVKPVTLQGEGSHREGYARKRSCD